MLFIPFEGAARPLPRPAGSGPPPTTERPFRSHGLDPCKWGTLSEETAKWRLPQSVDDQHRQRERDQHPKPTLVVDPEVDEDPSDLTAVAALAGVARRRNDVARAAETLSAASLAVDDEATAAALALESGIYHWQAGARTQAVGNAGDGVAVSDETLVTLESEEDFEALLFDLG